VSGPPVEPQVCFRSHRCRPRHAYRRWLRSLVSTTNGFQQGENANEDSTKAQCSGIVWLHFGERRARDYDLCGQTVVAGPVEFGGTLVAAIPSTISGPVIFGSLSAGVFSDPLNTYCPGCLDFFYFVGNSGVEPITGLFAASFQDFPLNVGYAVVPGGVAPSSITREPDGNGILFSFAPSVGQDQFSDFLVIQTPANSYTFGSATVEARGGTFGNGGSAFQPTPEPASLLLVSSGLLGIAGIVKARYRANQA